MEYYQNYRDAKTMKWFLILFWCFVLFTGSIFAGCGSSEERDKWRAIENACEVCPYGTTCEVSQPDNYVTCVVPADA